MISLFVLLVFSLAFCQEDITGRGRATQSVDYGHCIGDWCHYHLAHAALTGESHKWVDTNTYTCSSTALQKDTAWWKIAFSSVQYITRVKIYYREGSGYRLAGFSVYITNKTTVTTPPTGHLCYRHKGPELPNIYQDIDCHYLGKNVVIYNNRTGSLNQYDAISQTAILELCGVKVYGCKKGYSGNTCTKTCPTNCRGNHCFPENNTCVWGCNWENCQKQICNRYDGICTEGCLTGVTGDFCSETKSTTTERTTTHRTMSSSQESISSISDSTGGNGVTIGIAIALSVTVCIVIILSVVVFCRRRRLSSQTTQKIYQGRRSDVYSVENHGYVITDDNTTNNDLPPVDGLTTTTQESVVEDVYANAPESSGDDNIYLEMYPPICTNVMYVNQPAYPRKTS